MALITKVDAIDRSFLMDFAPELTPEGRSAALASFAEEKFREAQAINAAAAGGMAPTHEQFVDGRQGAPFASVKPDGRIVVEFDLQGEVVEWVWTEVLKAAPVRQGTFVKSHRLLADGVELTAPDPSITAEEWIIVSTVPYARKLEGMGHRQPLSRQAPHGVYQVVADIAKRRFGNIAVVKFVAVSVEGGMLSDWASKTKLSSRGHASLRHRGDWLRRQPAIRITFR